MRYNLMNIIGMWINKLKYESFEKSFYLNRIPSLRNFESVGVVYVNAFMCHYIETTSLILKCSNDANLYEKVKFNAKSSILKKFKKNLKYIYKSTLAASNRISGCLSNAQ